MVLRYNLFFPDQNTTLEFMRRIHENFVLALSLRIHRCG